MAAPINRVASQLLSLVTSKISGVSGVLGVVPARCMSKKTTVRNKRKRTPGKHLGWKRQDGCFVHAGEELVKQKSLRYYPGENVKFGGGKKSLYAITDGTVIVTAEKLSPYPDSPLYEPIQEGAVIFKKFFHVIPTPLHGKFRLVSQT